MSTEENKVVIIDRKFTDKEGYKHYNDFKVIRKYGEGSVGVVKEISNIISGKHYAMKIVNKLGILILNLIINLLYLVIII